MPNKQPRIIEQHDYISVVLGSRRLTTSYGGVRATGDIPRPVVQFWWDLFAGETSKPEALARLGLTSEAKNGEKIKAFVAHIDEIWADWAAEAPAPAVNETVMVDFGKRDGIDTGIVQSIKGTKAIVKFTRMGLIRIPFSMIRKAI